ncbi:hypothetical protein SOVF_161770 isoform B [Spinacia oleracea]|nr:hypothetical protein SOVF_161770 isoform B [Spinacia oleracea]
MASCCICRSTALRVERFAFEEILSSHVTIKENTSMKKSCLDDWFNTGDFFTMPASLRKGLVVIKGLGFCFCSARSWLAAVVDCQMQGSSLKSC